jgi:hypothetical protein
VGRFGALPVDQPPLLPLPPHPDRLPWPTRTWPRADIDRRVDRASLDRLLDYAFSAAEPDDLGRTNAVVIVQHGAIVTERYRQGVDEDRAFISWSMAKSITSCLVGILVHQGRLDISQPMPVKEWSADDRRRRITIDQMLRMTDGLRFREAEDLGDGSIRYYPEDESDVIPMLFGAGKDDVAAFAATLPYQAEPESRWNYNSGARTSDTRIRIPRIQGRPPHCRGLTVIRSIRCAMPVVWHRSKFKPNVVPLSGRVFQAVRFGRLFGILSSSRIQQTTLGFRNRPAQFSCRLDPFPNHDLCVREGLLVRGAVRRAPR